MAVPASEPPRVADLPRVAVQELRLEIQGVIYYVATKPCVDSNGGGV